MSEVITEKQALRETQIFQVLLLMYEDPSLSQKAACEKAGIAVSTFRHWIGKGSDTIEKLREFISMSSRQILFSTTMAKMGMVDRLIEIANNPKTEARDVLAITKFLSETADTLGHTLNATPGTEAAAHEFLMQGPQLQRQTSKLASVEISPTSSGVRVDVIKEDEIEDAQFSDTEK